MTSTLYSTGSICLLHCALHRYSNGVNEDIYCVTVCLDFCLSTLLVGFRFDKVREQGACLNAEESIFWVGISDNFADFTLFVQLPNPLV